VHSRLSGAEPPIAVIAPLPPDAAERTSTRLDWLDALRAMAVLAVVFEHLSWYVLPDWRSTVVGWVSPGTYGIMLFFLVSGYVVPASLERRNDLRQFWISRIFRLYPLWALALVLTAVVATFADARTPPELKTHPFATLAVQLTMLQDVAGGTSILWTMWTLSYEMLFYLLVTVLYIWGVHRKSVTIAVGLVAVAVLAGGVLPSQALSTGGAPGTLVVVIVTAFVVGLWAVTRKDRTVVLAGAGVLGTLAAVLITTNQRADAWEGFFVLAVMFTGTAIWRARNGQISRYVCIAAATAVFVGGAVAATWHGGIWFGIAPGPWIRAVWLAGLTFLAGLLLSRWRTPRFLSRIGLVSYSVYLLHLPLIFATKPWLMHFAGSRLRIRALATVVFLGTLLACCFVTYRFVELPAQRIGRKLARPRGQLTQEGRADAQSSGR
jgi:peptidoglycan/LPS O-acetylase OafA/YrhL